MNFLDNIYFENSVKSYLIVVAIVLLALMFRKFLSKYVASLFYLLLKRFFKNIDKEIFTDLVVQPLENFLLILISIFTIDKLNFPDSLNVKIYHVPIQTIIEDLGVGIILISFFLLILRLIDFAALVINKPASQKHLSDVQFVLFLKDFFKVLISIVGFLMILKFAFNAHIGELLTGLSIVGAALALAAKESLENLIASFIIFLDKPFVAGDMVKLQNFSGNVERIGLRSTRIRTLEKTLVTVPNKQMVDSILDNWTIRSQVKNDIKLELSPETSSEKIGFVILQVKKIFELHNKEIISSSVFLTSISRNGPLIIAEFFTRSDLPASDQSILIENINLSIKKMQEENEIKSSFAPAFSFVAKEANN